MHELSIALTILDLVADELRPRRYSRVVSVQLKLGPLSGVVKEALESAYELAREDSVAPDSRLVIDETSILAHCPACAGAAGCLAAEFVLCRMWLTDRSGNRRQRVGNRIVGVGNMITETRLVQVRQRVLKKNDVTARALRERFREAGVTVVSLVSSPGAGKTELVEKTLARLTRDFRVAALVGDLATDNDARRLARSGAPVRQITTGTVCHLEADMVERALGDWNLGELDFLIIENVGNLVCPSTYDLGEGLRLVLFSVTEGEDKPLKYPTIFNTADVALITKLDLAAAVECDLALVRRNIEAVRPGMRVFELSAKTGQGMDAWMDFLRSHAKDQRREPTNAGEVQAR